MQRARDTRAVVLAKLTDSVSDILEVVLFHLHALQANCALHKARFRHASEIEDYLQQLIQVGLLLQPLADSRRQHFQHRVQVVGKTLLRLSRRSDRRLDFRSLWHRYAQLYLVRNPARCRRVYSTLWR
jgi:hypothetical protein